MWQIANCFHFYVVPSFNLTSRTFHRASSKWNYGVIFTNVLWPACVQNINAAFFVYVAPTLWVLHCYNCVHYFSWMQCCWCRWPFTPNTFAICTKQMVDEIDHLWTHTEIDEFFSNKLSKWQNDMTNTLWMRQLWMKI